jgi:hypothetical protein
VLASYAAEVVANLVVEQTSGLCQAVAAQLLYREYRRTGRWGVRVASPSARLLVLSWHVPGFGGCTLQLRRKACAVTWCGTKLL